MNISCLNSVFDKYADQGVDLLMLLNVNTAAVNYRDLAKSERVAAKDLETGEV